MSRSGRHGIELQDAQVNTDVATLFLVSVLLPTIGGRSFVQHPKMAEELSKMDPHRMSDPIRRFATDVYKTKDGRWYQLHGSMNAEPTMRMMGVSDVDVSPEEAIEIYADKVAQWDAEEIERAANEQHKQAGVICYTPDEFFSSEHGRIMSKEPLWSAARPLAGIRIIDFSRIIAAPAVSMLLNLLGADVLRVSCDELPEYAPTIVDLQTGKRDANLDLKTDEGRSAFAGLRLGFDCAALRKLGPSLIYMRENCYGFKGPLAHRSGWQQISDCLVGLSHLQGKFLGLNEAVVPLLPNSDYQTGLVGAAAAVQALLARTKEDVTFDIDISLTQ
ncbi:Succinate--hydroxymethylglutarate CoA-transferase [Colletotrichum shisoi]|uniref:Succinate--hydroxymethylglutarate CoA-transferase n=1 Tax=Colletotrichum shisoi TaxID=2078593 RepID=A0A5Q4BHS9_9PEZI|nr:Succinate--hydroxymethylglutarate CoA-transferase [Colletotrichum shisoi]